MNIDVQDWIAVAVDTTYLGNIISIAMNIAGVIVSYWCQG